LAYRRQIDAEMVGRLRLRGALRQRREPPWSNRAVARAQEVRRLPPRHGPGPRLDDPA
jgi:hypothetical protein